MPIDNEWLQTTKPRVNSSLLNGDRYSNQVVSILGRVDQSGIDPSGCKVTIDTSDHQSILIRFRQPLQEPLTNYVDFVGRVLKGGRELDCIDYTPIKDDVTENFDFDQYNKAIEIGNKLNIIDTTSDRQF